MSGGTEPLSRGTEPMTEKTQPPDADEDPAPLKHSDAERVTGTEAARSTPSEEQPPGHVPEDRN